MGTTNEPQAAGFVPKTRWQQFAERAPIPPCHHGGASIEDIGIEPGALERGHEVISADVLDAWFPPAPRVLEALREHLDWIVRTSPPTSCSGMARAIARARGVPEPCVLCGAGSSDLMFRALPRWFGPGTRALVLAPTYGEYTHLLERVIGARAEVLPLFREDGYRMSQELLRAALARRYELVVLVNPNSPTGTHVPGRLLESLLAEAPRETLVWVDETYVDYAGPEHSIERWAASTRNVIVCKSMSKGYALSGLRVAYLCGSGPLLADLRAAAPPWVASLPGQVAVARALEDADYYSARWRATDRLRAELTSGLEALGFDVTPAVANFVLCHVGAGVPDAAALVAACRGHGLYLRALDDLGPLLGTRALRIAVKDAATNRRMLEILGRVLGS